MSLLIDALKKAEQEKKEAARRLKEAQEKSGEGIRLEPSLENRKEPLSLQTETPVSEDALLGALSISAEKKRSVDLSSSPLEEYTINKPLDLESTATDLGVQAQPASLSLQKEELTHEVEAALPASGTQGSTDKLSIQGEDPAYTLANLTMEESAIKPLDDTDQPKIKDTFADTLSGSRVSRPAITAAELVKDMGGSRTGPTPVAAQTVFSAVNTVSGKRQILEWTMFIGLFAVILAAGGALYYLKLTPTAVSTSSPMVARGIEAELAPPVIVPLPEIVTETGTAAVPETMPEATVAGSDAIPSVTSNDVNIATPAEDSTAALPESPILEDRSDTPVVVTDTPEQEPAPAEPVDLTAPALPETLPEDIPVEAAAIAISRSRAVDKNDQLINDAYADYSDGNYSGAEMAYRQVLETMPGNRDALLGMAALAHQKGQMQEAYEFYLRVLKLYPRDIAATTALINIQGSADPVRSESVLKLMIQEQPEAAFLHFALGNNYAGQSRWADAQSAFFEAYRREPENGDFAYNLAISLDRLGQSGAALDYYRKALELADRREPSFNTSTVLARVNNLTTQSQ